MGESFVLAAREGQTVSAPVGGEITFKVRGEQTDGGLTILENEIGPGEGPPLHIHPNEDEALYVIEGNFRFRLGDEIIPASAGSIAFIRRTEPHTWQNVGPGPGRMLVIFSPAGMERFFDAFAAMAAPGPCSFAEAGQEAQMEVVGPPLAQTHPL